MIGDYEPSGEEWAAESGIPAGITYDEYAQIFTVWIDGVQKKASKDHGPCWDYLTARGYEPI